MQASYFLHLMQHPGNATSEDLEKIQELEENYPFSANLAITKARILHEKQDVGFQKALETAAAKTISRRKLKSLIEGPLVLDWEWKAIATGEEIELEAIEEDYSNEMAPLEWAEEAQIHDPEEPEQENTPMLTILPQGKNPFGFSFVKVGRAKTEKTSTKSKPGISQPYELKEEEKSPKYKKKQDSLIEKFLETTPSISPPTIDFGSTKNPDLSAQSVVLDEEIITENMAIIYLKQKNYPKALSIYRKLQLKFPEKNGYFAALIKNLETTIL